MKEPRNRNQKNVGGGLTIGLMVTGIGLAFYIFGRTFLFSETSLPKSNINWVQILATFFVALTINIILCSIGFLYARKYQWQVILWLNNRLFPQVEKRKKPRPEKKIIKVLGKINPEEGIRTEDTRKNYGTFDSVAGEKFLGPLFFKNWIMSTAWNTFWFAIKISMVLSIIITFANSIFIWIVALPLPLISIVAIVLFYWKKEWQRMVGFFLVTNYRYGWAEGQFSWPGLIINKGFDVKFVEKSLSVIASVSIDPVPKGAKVGKVYEMLLEILAESQANRLGTISIDTIIATDSVVLSNFSFAPYIHSLINQARELYGDIQNQISLVSNTADRYMVGDPDKRGNLGGREQKASIWQEKQMSRLNLTAGEEVNVFKMHTDYIRSLAGYDAVSEETDSPSPTIPKFPGNEVEVKTNNNQRYIHHDDPII
jgi:hypothetical protein